MRLQIMLVMLSGLLMCGCGKTPASTSSAETSRDKAPSNAGVSLDESFSVDGVGLYPGARVTRMTVDSRRSDKAPEMEAVVVGFDASAPAETVARWFETQMRQRSFAVNRAGGHLQAKSPSDARVDIVIGDRPEGSAGTLTVNRKEKD